MTGFAAVAKYAAATSLPVAFALKSAGATAVNCISEIPTREEFFRTDTVALPCASPAGTTKLIWPDETKYSGAACVFPAPSWTVTLTPARLSGRLAEGALAVLSDRPVPERVAIAPGEITEGS